MRKLVFLFSTIAISSVAFAQNYEEARNFLFLNNYKKAKELVDKNWSNAKYTAKPEGHLLKATVYAGVSTDSSMASQSAALRDEALATFNKYKEMEPSLKLLSDTTSVYRNTPAILYGGYFNSGYAKYIAKDWEGATKDFETVVTISDFLIENKLIDMKLDTNGLLLAGASAQGFKKDDVAAKYYSRLAEAKVGGKENEFFYQFLAGHHIQQGDIAGFNKYLNLARQAFPDSKNFDYDDVDYIIQIEDETVKNSLIEKKLAADPNNYKLQAVIGETIFDKLNGKDTANARPANYDELEQKMISAFVKASELKAGNGFPLSNLGNHFMNKSIAVSKEQEEFRNYMRDKRQAATPAPAAKPKPGTKPVAAKAPADDPADVAKREELKKRYFDAITTAGVYFQKAVDIYSKIPSPTNIEKQQYRNAVSYLIDINRELKDNSKGKLAEYDKFEKEEKKWTAEYSKL